MDFLLIAAEDHFALLAALFAIGAFSIWADRTPLGQRVSGVIIAILAGLVFSNLGVIPKAAPIYDIVWSLFVPLAIPLLLLRADLGRIVRESGPTLVAFLIGAVGIVAGAVIGFSLFALGERGADLAATLAASWIGGSMNFAATSRALELSEPTLLSAGLAADAVAATLFLLILVALPGSRFLVSWLKPMGERAEEVDTGVAAGAMPPNLLHLAALLALTAGICAAGEAIAAALGIANLSVLFITVIAVAIANLFSRQLERLQGDFELGMLFMYIFFAVIGAGADVFTMVESGAMLFVYTMVMGLVHLAVVLAGARLVGISLPEALIASNACALGPATAAAMAASQGWRQLVTPGIMVGILGYAIATFIGVALAGWFGGAPAG